MIVILFFIALLQTAVFAALFCWPAFHLTKRWGVGALFGLWLNASLLFAWVFAKAMDLRLRGLGVLAEDREQYTSFWSQLPMAMLMLAAAAAVVYWRVRKGDARFTPLTALRGGLAMLLGMGIFMTVSFVLYVE